MQYTNLVQRHLASSCNKEIFFDKKNQTKTYNYIVF